MVTVQRGGRAGRAAQRTGAQSASAENTRQTCGQAGLGGLAGGGEARLLLDSLPPTGYSRCQASVEEIQALVWCGGTGGEHRIPSGRLSG